MGIAQERQEGKKLEKEFYAKMRTTLGRSTDLKLFENQYGKVSIGAEIDDDGWGMVALFRQAEHAEGETMINAGSQATVGASVNAKYKIILRAYMQSTTMPRDMSNEDILKQMHRDKGLADAERRTGDISRELGAMLFQELAEMGYRLLKTEYDYLLALETVAMVQEKGIGYARGLNEKQQKGLMKEVEIRARKKLCDFVARGRLNELRDEIRSKHPNVQFYSES